MHQEEKDSSHELKLWKQDAMSTMMIRNTENRFLSKSIFTGYSITHVILFILVALRCSKLVPEYCREVHVEFSSHYILVLA